MLKVTIIDNQALFSKGLSAAILSEMPDISFVLKKNLSKCRPEPETSLAILCINDVGQLFTCKRMVLPESLPVILVFDMQVWEDHINECMAMSAAGYIAKNATKDDFLACVNDVLSGETYLFNALTPALQSHLNEFQRFSDVRRRLTRKQYHVADSLFKQMRVGHIATSQKEKNATIKSLKSDITQKLDERNISELEQLLSRLDDGRSCL
jgi:DNA-binding NarL/FixJ family response regulator